ncbi:type II secretion system protein [Achromobacter xylosoxidans]|uniref:type II secretion system protein n=1 Tax=Alcaligenes xylosoxydans xylosoxydans TaxID=85698 RepID=UPI0008A623A6|nr:prepilin-type N-terminal cleavage/methylation domain-containing protein [Achromobacter xylosoxidans]MCZ8438769.1 prepilin-type N-terminal cleavage/methylation domain-containing protein [Achromobacter xylosoxidans]OFQ38194.1 hypothetical protein HMPREF2939_06635 [Achromobacter xylosoxidans]
MRHVRPFATEHRRQQQGFSLVETIIAILVATILVTLAASLVKREIDDAAARGTGKYLLQLRAAVVDLQLKHEAWLRGEPLSDVTAAAAPKLAWTTVGGGVQAAYGGVDDLKALGLLPAGAPRYPALGDLARFILVRQGVCPSPDCRASAFVYTCHPISAQRSLRRGTACTAPAGPRARYSPALLGQVLQAAGGYGGHDTLDSTNVQGALMNVPRVWFDFADAAGHAVLAAGLDATPFGQFVRHGDTRPVTLHNTLTVDLAIETNTGLLLNTAAVAGEHCAPDGLYASTKEKTLVQCLDGAWFPQSGHVITAAYQDLPNGAAVPALACPAGQHPWRHVALQTMDVTVGGADVNIAGSVGGVIHGNGQVNAAGAVTVGGAFSGTFQNAGASSVHVAQAVSVANDRIVISPPDMNARAALLQGCGN